MFKYTVVLLFFTGFFNNCFAQLQGSKRSHDFGTIHNYNNDTAFFEFTNTSDKTVFLLPTQPREDYQVFCNTKTIPSGATIIIGLIYYTPDKGKFNVDVPLYFSNSNQPMVLKMKGDIKSIHPNAMTICPSIENSKPLNHTVPLNIIVRDKQTNVQLKDAIVKVSQKQKVTQCVPGFRSMAFMCNCEYGKMTISANHEGYVSETVSFDFSADNNTCLIYLDKPVPEASDTVKEEIVLKEEVKTETIVKKEKITVKKEEKQEEKDTGEILIGYQPVKPAPGDFDKTLFKPNHLIFVIDISGSMKDSTKLWYLKESMKSLIAVLRPEDHITLITYARRINTVFENVSGLSKERLYDAIDTLTARGSTAGGEALVGAYAKAREYLIEGGNNQIFLATDGMFNNTGITEDDLYKLARHDYLKYGVKLTTIAFGKYPRALEFLEKLAEKGRGNMIAIKQLPGDKDALVEEVKKQSRR